MKTTREILKTYAIRTNHNQEILDVTGLKCKVINDSNWYSQEEMEQLRKDLRNDFNKLEYNEYACKIIDKIFDKVLSINSTNLVDNSSSLVVPKVLIEKDISIETNSHEPTLDKKYDNSQSNPNKSLNSDCNKNSFAFNNSDLSGYGYLLGQDVSNPTEVVLQNDGLSKVGGDTYYGKCATCGKIHGMATKPLSVRTANARDIKSFKKLDYRKEDREERM